ncbi:MAG TPA: DegT/DnrJ/EryC1/StrS family aminotransferase [bacterium]|nr:DegT/DnrJ/EryC1/StrS family aminotransferase [bacterium]
MSRLAINGGDAVTKNWLVAKGLKKRRDLERQFLLEAYDSDVWDDWPETESQASRFAAEWAEFCGSAFCALLTNGTHTLQVALETLDIGAGDEVIVPGLTWQATASAVCDVNAVPVIVDIEPDTLCIDPALVEAAITSRTRAIIPVHLYHRMADLDQLSEIARKHNLAIVEDCAHTHGSRWRDKGAGTLGTLGSYSFQRSKLLTAGEGGALLMQNEEIYWKVVSQRSCGREYRAGIKIHSGNYRMTSLQAAVLRGQLMAFRENASLIDARGRDLDRAVDAAPGVRSLRRHKAITRQCSYMYAFLLEPQEWPDIPATEFRQALAAELGIEFYSPYTPLSHSEVYYPHSKKRHHLNKAYLGSISPSRWDLPICDDIWQNRAVLALWPVFGVAVEQVTLLTDAIAKLHKERDELRRGIQK